MNVTSATGGPLLTAVRVTSGWCTPDMCSTWGSSSCSSLHVSTTDRTPSVGATCDLVAVATDGRSQSFRITVVQSDTAFTQCCGYPLPPYSGIWTTYTPMGFDNTNVVVDFGRDAGVSDGPASGDGASKPDGLNLAGLTAMTLTSTWIPRTSDPPGACHTDTKNVYSLDLQTRVLNWEHCAVDPKTAAAFRKTEAQTLTDYEVTASRMLLAFPSTSNRTECGADADTETLDLTFGDRVEKYQDDFYACNPPLDGRTYLTNMDWIVGWLIGLGKNSNALPSSFVSLSVMSEANFPSDTAMTAATAACGDFVYPTYDVTAATKKLSWSSCVSGSTGYKLQTGNRVLTQSEFASVMQSWSAIQLGATGDCSTPRTSKSLAVETATSVSSLYYENDLTACSLSDYYGAMPVVGLDDFSALLVSLAH